jgi:hypothetical protein
LNWKVFFERMFYLMATLAIFVVVIVFIFVYIDANAEEYRFAVIGATGSLIGGALTLVGVWWTMQRNYKEKFIEDFPKKIKAYNDLSNALHNIIEKNTYLGIFSNVEAKFLRRVDEMLLMTLNIDGNAYLKVKELKKIHSDYKDNWQEINGPESNYSINEFISETRTLEEATLIKVKEVLESLKAQENNATKKFFSFQKKL